MLISLHLVAKAQSDSTRHVVLLQTTMGDIKIELYNETPIHRDNFLKLISKGKLDSILFHRVIDGFMIQSGDPHSKVAKPGEFLGLHQEGKEIPAEILYPKFWHKRGALAAARQPDETNPDRKSSGSQFYLVYGKRWRDSELDDVQKTLDTLTAGKVKLTPEIREAYYKKGGYPYLDGQYTVFGETIEGLDVIKQINWVEVDKNKRPLQDVRILKAVILK